MEERAIAKTNLKAKMTILDCDNFGINPIHSVMDTFDNHIS